MILVSALSGAWFNFLRWFYSMSLDSALSTVIDRYLELLTAPAVYTDMLWIILPLLGAMFAMELYFGVYTSEELGWSTATANVLFLVFISLDLFRQLFKAESFSLSAFAAQPVLFGIAGTLMFLGIMMFVLNFLHVLPRKLAFSISSVLPINLFAYLAIVLVYSNLLNLDSPGSGIPLDSITVVAALALYVTLFVLFGLVHLLEPHERST